MDITAQDLGFMYQILEKAVTSGKDTDKAYQLKMKLIAILKAMQDAQPKAPEATPEVTEAPKEAEPVKDALDMK